MLGAWSVPEPRLQAIVDFLLRLIREVALEVLSHDADSGLEKIQRDTEPPGRRELFRFCH